MRLLFLASLLPAVLLWLSAAPEKAAAEPLAPVVSYFLGADPGRWHTGLPGDGQNRAAGLSLGGALGALASLLAGLALCGTTRSAAADQAPPTGQNS
ncbi:MAG TPA: hypothetical protein VKY74_02050 [Chloroflexia bacterium]|nr:hypothetical protein [Chloroflexia bacterium]